MAQKTSQKKVTTVHEHTMRVPVTKKNPSGLTLRDQHVRRIPGSYLKREDLDKIFVDYPRKNLKFPTAGKIPEDPNSDKFDELIAVWVAYFNAKLSANPQLEVNVFKALLGSESSFKTETPENRIAFGIAQITKQTLAVVQDPQGEAKDFVFKDIRLKDLADPAIAIPVAARWLIYKSQRAKSKLGRPPSTEEVILEYKGLFKSQSPYKQKALASFRKYYEKLRK